MTKLRNLLASEAQEQRALVKWINTQPLIKEHLVKLNNEGKRTCSQGYQLKLLGMCPGASDLFLAFPRRPHCGLWLEIKQNRNYTPSERAKPTWVNQEKFLERMINVGYQGHFVFGWEHGKKLIERYFEGTQIIK